jgi:hypothetical protein
MGITVLTIRRWKCDRCPTVKEFDNDANAARGGWSQVSVNNNSNIVLCPKDSKMHEFFLAGETRPAATVFNLREHDRYISAMDLADPAMAGRHE